MYFVDRSAGNWVSGNAGTGGTESEDAAMAAYCAADQGKYWQMHDALFSNNMDVEEQGAFAPKRLKAIAQSVGLDMNTFNSCFDGGKYKDQVNKDLQDAKAAGITGTPFFVITYTVNGETKTDTVDGAQPFGVFQQKIDAALAATGSK
jgi:protein-disulfide isomerase